MGNTPRVISRDKMNRKYLPTLSELIDRLAIVQLKEVKIPDHRETYSQEIADICYDIDQILTESNAKLDADAIRAIIVLAEFNNHIWVNEEKCRAGSKDGNNLELSHSLNGVRNRAKNRLQEKVGGRKDYKVDCLAADHAAWEPSWDGPSKPKE